MDKTIYSPSDDSYFLSSILSKELLKIKDKSKLKFLEMGIGSGVQLKNLEKNKIKKTNIVGADINPLAVEHCKSKNFNCIVSDLFKNIKGKFDILIFNPPYLPRDLKEPKDSQIATTGGKKGSEIINKFLKQAEKHLNEKGSIYLLTSSLTKNTNFQNYKKILLGEKKLFYEILYVWKLS